MARKPLEGTVAQNVLKWGVGALNINGCRIHANTEGDSGWCPIHGVRGMRQSDAPMEKPSSQSQMANDVRQKMQSGKDEGDWQSELGEGRMDREQDGIQASFSQSVVGSRPKTITEPEAPRLSGTSNGDGAPFEADITAPRKRPSYQREQDRQSHRKSHANRLEISRPGTRQNREADDGFNGRESTTEICTCKGAGNNQAPLGRWPSNVIHDGSEEVVAGFPESQDGVAVGGKGNAASIYGTDLEKHNAENQGYGGGGSAARFFYTAKADSDDRLGSKHPTVKPLDLMQYLVRLVTPPRGVVLDPFAGTGTTGEAAWREGFNAVLIERETEYQADIRRRMALALSGPDERSRESIKEKLKGKPVDHGPLFGGTDKTQDGFGRQISRKFADQAKWENGDKPYDPQDDFAKSLEVGYRAIRERVANGGERGFMGDPNQMPLKLEEKP